MIDVLRRQPALVVFLVIGIGYLLDRVRIRGVQIGVTTGVLFGGLLLGHLGLSGSSGSQSVGFMLFIYCVGLRAGPQFFRAFRENGARFAVLAVVVGVAGITGAVVLDRALALPPGYRAGLLAGALTSTPTLVAAQDVIRGGMTTLPAGYDASAITANIAAAYAITYVVGLFGLLVVIALLPRVMGIDLKAEARRLDAERAESEGAVGPPSYADLPLLRVYRVTRGDPHGTPAGPSSLRRAGCLVQGVKRDGVVVDPTAQTRLEMGDLVAVLGRRPAHRTAAELLGPESVDADLLEVRPETRTFLVTGSKAGGRTTPTLGRAAASGCIPIRLIRAGLELPTTSDLALVKGDVVTAVGLPRNLDALAGDIGRSELPADETDLVTFAFGMAAGIAVGMLSVRVAGIPIGLGTAGGLLLSGLIVGFARTTNPTFGQLPLAAASVLMELGLQFFIANVGLEAGGSVVAALRATGMWLPIGAFAVMAVPLLIGFVVGRGLLGLDPVTLLGALTGALTSTPALGIVTRQAESALPTVGYAGTYAFANVLLAIAGSVLVRF